MDFSHLHVHSQFSLLDGAASIKSLMKKASDNQMKAVALTDHGNMFGAFQFVSEASKYNIKPIVGCEFYVVEDRHRKEFTKGDKDVRYHQLLLAKDQEGYKNLSKLCSLGYIDGLYSKWPRIDKELVRQYSKGLIATSCCIGAEVPQAILRKSEAEAEAILKEWIDIFGEDYYIELQRHGLQDLDGTGKSQEDLNQILLKWAKKYDVKVIATNDSHYIDEGDWNAHDILLCVNTGELKSSPVGDGSSDRLRLELENGQIINESIANARNTYASDKKLQQQINDIQQSDSYKRGKTRFGFPNNRFYFKTQEEMTRLFHDIPDAIANTGEIVDKITTPKLQRDILLPNFSLPVEFSNMDDYLRHLTYEGARKRYTELTPEIEERLNHELHIINTMGFAGYFLIVQDFIAAGKHLGVAVGPGRGSAAGSAVAYCVGITNIDPIKYSLLFERFLNPERVSMPDIDIDFDDEGRQKVIDYVVDKYGKNQVAQIITFGTMAAKSSIKDVARVLDLPLSEANYLAKLVPDAPGTSLKKAFSEVKELADIKKGTDLKAQTLQLAEVLEGSVRNTGIHAAGVIIAPDDITNYIPVSTSKESDLYITQFDGKLIESAGMLKMDFLGLKTLTIIRDALRMIKKNHGTTIDMDNLVLDDLKTYELYQRGDTVGTFQFESDGMRKYLRELKPTNIEDLIAMNALYRPGPMDFIPLFINRKHGREKVEYPHPLLEPILSNSYGIMVYQEQIMQTAQIIAGYSLGGADLLRRAMGKKDKEKMAKEREKFVAGAAELHQIPADHANEIFNVMEKFAEYGFNRSHSAAYSVVAYHTAFLKANYPAEYMASVLTHNMNSIEKVAFFMDECNKQNIKVLGPDVNESSRDFDVPKAGHIRFGLAAIKGTGESAVDAIILEREGHGPYTDVFNFAQRVNLRSVNKKTFESLAMAGGFDNLDEYHRAQYFTPDAEGNVFLEKLIKYGGAWQSDKESSNMSLFGESTAADIQPPKVPDCEPWNRIVELSKEKDLVGFFISGHPLDDYRIEIDKFTNTTIADIDISNQRQVSIAGIVTKVVIKRNRSNEEIGFITIEDFSGNTEIKFWRSSDFLKFRNLLAEGKVVFMRGERKPRYNNPNEFEISWNDVMLLSEVHDKLCKSITIQIPLETVSEQMTSQLEVVLSENNGGSCPVKIEVVAANENIKLNMGVDKYRLRPSNELLQQLSKIRDVQVQLN